MEEDIKIDIKDSGNMKRLFDDCYIPLCLFAERYLGDAELSEDVVQDCFIRLWQCRGEFSYLYQVKSFLYTAVRNGALNELEHRKVVGAYAGKIADKAEEAFFRDHVVEEETYRILLAAIGKLPDQTRRVMMLALEGNDNKKIAASLNIADGTVHTLKKIAYKRLREELKEYFYLLLPFI